MSFDWLAPHYRWLEFVLAGSKLQRCRTAFLEESLALERVLIVGEGHGRFLLECRRHLPEVYITCVEQSAPMLKEARQRLAAHGLSLERVEFTQADAREWTPPEDSFDLVVTQFFLDCFPADQLAQVIRRLAQAAAPRARWWLADFRIPDRGTARFRAALIHWLMYRFFRLTTALPAWQWTPPDDLLRAQGFELRQRRIREWGLLYADEWTRELRLLKPRFCQKRRAQ